MLASCASSSVCARKDSAQSRLACMARVKNGRSRLSISARILADGVSEGSPTLYSCSCSTPCSRHRRGLRPWRRQWAPWLPAVRAPVRAIFSPSGCGQYQPGSRPRFTTASWLEAMRWRSASSHSGLSASRQCSRNRSRKRICAPVDAHREIGIHVDAAHFHVFDAVATQCTQRVSPEDVTRLGRIGL